MPDQSPLETGPCAFCNREQTRDTLLFEGRDFYVIADHAPISDAHLLIIPYEHLPHLAALPRHLHDEFEELKALVGNFVSENYGALTYWENGVFGQSVPHAHLHAMSVSFDARVYLDEGHPFRGIAGLQEAFAANGSHYFTIEQEGEARLLPPDPALHMRVVQCARESRPTHWRFGPEERRRRGRPVIDAVMRRWQVQRQPSLDRRSGA